MDGFAGLAEGQFSTLQGNQPILPQDISFSDALSGRFSNRLVRIEGQVVSQTRENHLDSLFLRSGDRVFQALFRKPAGDPDPIPAYPVGTRIRVTGVCTVHIRGFWGAVESFQIHLRSPEDITVAESASWWTLGHLFFVTSALFAIAVVALAWGLRMRRRVLLHEQLLRQRSELEATRMSTLAHLERQRSHILELINSFQPLPIVLTAIQAYANEMWPGTFGYLHMLADRKLLLMGRSHVPAEALARLEAVDPSSSPEPCAEAVRSRRLTGTAGDRHAWSSPIFSSRGEILGTMTFESAAAAPLAINPKAFDFGCNLAAIAIDNRRLYEDVLHRSEHDQLTGLPNRSLVETRLTQALQKVGIEGGFVAVLYLDLDDFKAVNDTYTHRIGDCFLIEVSQRFKSCLRDCDTLGRIGGDEFLAVLADLADPSLAHTIAERLVRTMEGSFSVEGHIIHGSVSIGVAVHPGPRGTTSEITQLADHAMYVAKRAGGNQVSYVDASLIAP
jgi:diguanylate cyclase (GGDEF)-like protein